METLLRLAGSNAVAAILLAAIVAIVTRLCRRPAVRHALWLLVLLKLITPPLVPLSVHWPLDTANGRRQPAGEALQPADETLQPAGETLDVPAGELLDEPVDEALHQPADADRSPWLPLVMAVWLGGSLTWWTIAAVRLCKFQRLLRQARPAPAEVREQARRLAALLGLRRCPPIAFVSAPLSPMLWALGFSPRLLIPAELWRNLGTEQQDTLLAHELAHLRRGDHWVRRLEFVVLGLYWWHPVVWWTRRRLQEAEEECCDALVVSILPDAASAYAAALVETVAFLSQARAAAYFGASGAGQVPLLKRRLTMILNANPSRRPARAAFWAVLGLGALFLPLAPGAARTGAPEESQGTESQDRQPQTVQSGKPQHKPQSGKESHDEAIRLMDEVRRLRTQFRDDAKHPLSIAERNRDEQIEKLKDEIELLKLQVRLKEAHLRITKTQHAEADRRYKSWKETNKRTPGSIPQDIIAEGGVKAKTLEGEAEIKEVELQEARLLLKHAERRLARLQQPAERSAPQAPQSFSHDFGKVKQGTVIKYRFPLSNPNRHPLRITRISSSAGCLKAQAKEIEPGGPGGKIMIDIELDTKRFQGDKTCVLSIQFEDGQERRWVFHAVSEAVSSGATGPDKQEQLKELERKIESLQKEIRDLRREMKPKKPDGPGQSSKEPPDGLIWKKLGLRLRTVGGDVVKRSMPQFRGGLMITEVRPDSPAERSGVQRGDILVGLHKFEMLSNENVHYVLNQSESTAVQPLKFYVLRNNQLQDGKFQLGE